ncbi:MAG: hypothetical protein HYR66_16075 [Sphingobacteriales bacterium]|nr:hypothetical protein [Sphingobacteriales bacterium]MBI3717844.1 hypothetical protein [Sphingobacteriales bacterium]
MKNGLTALLLLTFVSLQCFSQNTDDKTQNSSNNQITLTIMPNPVRNNRVIVKLEGLNKQQYNIRILNNSGDLSATDKFNSPTSTTFRMIDLKRSFKGYGRLQLIDEQGKIIGQSKFLAVD